MPRFPFALALAVAGVLPLHAQDASPPAIGKRLEPFVDAFLIDRLEGVEHRLHHPRLAPPSPAPPSDGHYATVLFENGRYRLYNRAGPPGADGHGGERTEVFESADGVHWARPLLGLFHVDGSTANNVVLAHDPPFSHNFSPLLDTRPGVPADERYKALAGTEKSGGLFAFASADGLRWHKLRDEPVITDGQFDSQNVAFWSPAEQAYVCYFRTWTEGGYDGLRTISRTTSSDFLTWSAPVATRANEPGEHLYTSGAHPYFRAPHIVIALPTRFHPDLGAATDILLMSSRGGSTFDRPFKEAFIRPGPDPAHWRNRSNYAALNVVPTGPAELSVYVRGRRYTLRTDGFASIHAGYEEGSMTTRPFTFSGDSLLLNISTSAAGAVRVEIQDAHGAPIPGYSLADVDPVVGDTLAWPVTWQGNTDVGGLEGREVRLHFVLREADLYALRFR